MNFEMILHDSDLEDLIVESIQKKFPTASVSVKWGGTDYTIAYVNVEADL